ncbi:type II toxin-antitoxin system HicA family toxin [bacterium]|nr:type II toxin-antitoxin system HicA family toxin [bacterium]
MTQKQKLVTKLLSDPKNFTWDDLVKLLKHFGYRKAKSGRTSGSRRRFVHATYAPISLHEPHPQKVLKAYQVGLVIEALQKEGLI